MDFKSLFYTIFKALNPYNYKELIETRFSQIIKYFFFILFLTLVLMFILFVPTIYSTTHYISKGMSHFDNLTVSSNMVLKDSFNALNSPVIRFENQNTNLTNEFILITPDTISYKSYLFFGSERDLILNHAKDLTTDNKVASWLGLLFFFMLPSLIFWSIIFSIVYFTVIILLTLIIMLMIAGVFRVNIKVVNLLKVCIYSSTLYIMLQLLLLPFFRVFLFPLAIYWLLVIVILFVLRDTTVDNVYSNRGGSKSSHTSYNSTGSKTSSIFGKHTEGSSTDLRSKKNVQDSYDVDENGNARGSSSMSKKSKYNNDNDGYVELK